MLGQPEPGHRGLASAGRGVARGLPAPTLPHSHVQAESCWAGSSELFSKSSTISDVCLATGKEGGKGESAPEHRDFMTGIFKIFHKYLESSGLEESP